MYSSVAERFSPKSFNRYLYNVIMVMQDQSALEFPSIVIGSQEWMTSNLSVTHYRNGDPLAQSLSFEEWRGLSSGATCSYEKDNRHDRVFGRLYNWHAVNDSRGLAPEGWRIAEDSDWQELIDFLGGHDIAGGALKEKGTAIWKGPNTGASNSSGFAAIPAGFRSLYGDFRHQGLYGYYWSATQSRSNCAWIRVFGYFDSRVLRTGGALGSGYSVRCIKA